MQRLYMEEQQEFFPHLDHWSQVFWAVVNEIVDNNEKRDSSDDEWTEYNHNPLPEVDVDVLL